MIVCIEINKNQIEPGIYLQNLIQIPKTPCSPSPLLVAMTNTNSDQLLSLH